MTRLLLLVLAVAVLAMACDDVPAADSASPAPTAATTPSTTATPSPGATSTPSAPAVQGSKSTTTVLVSSTGIVDRDTPPEPDRDALRVFVNAIRRALDDHLTDLGHGGPGTLDQMRAPRVPAIGPELTSALATPVRWIETASYTFTVGHEGSPLWARVETDLRRSDGSTASPTFVFFLGKGDLPRLTAWEAANPDQPASPATGPSSAPLRTHGATP